MGVLLLFPTLASAYHGGIGGPQSHQGSTGQVDIDDVAKSGCLCHNEVADNAVQVILVDVPFAYVAGETYPLRLQLIGGPPATGTYTAGFSMRVSLGTWPVMRKTGRLMERLTNKRSLTPRPLPPPKTEHGSSSGRPPKPGREP